MTKPSEVIVVGAGPAGIAAAIAVRKHGLRATVLDARTPPIDKPCGEGILPQGVEALRALGISVPPEFVFTFRGIRFSDQFCAVQANFGSTPAISVRRTNLHEALVDHASRLGVEFRWGTRVTRVAPDFVETARGKFSFNWLIGADGQKSQVRKWAGLEPRREPRKRFGFCSHFRQEPWSDDSEVHWGRGFQIFVTPMAQREVGLAVLTRDPHLRLAGALQHFPKLANKLRGAERSTKEWGDATALRRLPAVTRGPLALIGDASGTVDAVTGHGLGLAFQQAICLADAIKRGSLSYYESEHKRIAAVPRAMSRLMLLMERHDWIRRRSLRLFQSSPNLFAKMLAIHAGLAPLASIGAADLAGFGWKFLSA